MRCITLLMAVVASVFLTGFARAADNIVTWDGSGSSQWADFNGGAPGNNWTHAGDGSGNDLNSILGFRWAINGYTDDLGGASVVIDGAQPNSAVTYDPLYADLAGLGSNAFMSQGSSLTISNGASLDINTPAALGGNEGPWTMMDGSQVTLDGGTLKRTRSTVEVASNGPWIFGSWNQIDNNRWVDTDLRIDGQSGIGGGDNDVDGFDFLRLQAADTDAGPFNAFVSYAASDGVNTTSKVTYLELWEKQFGLADPNYVDIKVDISNNGQFINEKGQLWLGGPRSYTSNVTFTINDGDIALDGGALPGEGEGEAPGIEGLVASLTLFLNGADRWDTGEVPGHGAGDHTVYNNQLAFNFTTAGGVGTVSTITVDNAGIKTHEWDGTGDSENPANPGVIITSITDWEELWDLGIIQLDGVTGTGADDLPAGFASSGPIGVEGVGSSSTLTFTVPAPALSASTGSVPEPTSALLAGIALVVGLSTARRHRA